jgi:DNA-binding MarR family transcriptional regulator
VEPLGLSRALHTLTARLDRAGDQILRAEAGLSYSRFLALYMVGFEGADTQRVLAERLGVTEPSVSRMTRILAQTGLLEAVSDPAGGNRHRLRLSQSGQELVERWGGELERRFASLVQRSGVPYDLLLEHTERLLDTLDAAGSWTSSARETAVKRRADR